MFKMPVLGLNDTVEPRTKPSALDNDAAAMLLVNEIPAIVRDVGT